MHDRHVCRATVQLARVIVAACKITSGSWLLAVGCWLLAVGLVAFDRVRWPLLSSPLVDWLARQ